MISKKLYRDEDNKVVAGVAAGLARYFDVDPVLVRLIFVVLAFANGLGVLAYLIMWLVVPSERLGELSGEETMRANFDDMRERVRGFGEKFRGAPQGTVIMGLVLVLVGAMFLLDAVMPGFDKGMLWPLALIVIGAYLLVTRR